MPDTNLLNAFQDSQQFDQYDVDSNTATTLDRGDAITPVLADGMPLTSAVTYMGTTTVNNAAVTSGIPGVATITLQVNPISGDMMQADGHYYFISDQPLDDAHLAVTATATIAGRSISVTGPISEITNQLAAEVATIPIVGPGLAATINATGNQLQTAANTATVTMNSDPSGTLALSDEEVFCFVAGTLIETPEGWRPVEDLAPGDLVMTRDNGPQPIRWVGSVRLSGPSLARHARLRPIRIRAGALGPDTPRQDLLVSPQHRVLVRSNIAMRMFGALEVLIAARQLLQLDWIDVATDLDEVHYVHILFDRHEVVNSNGAPTESLYAGTQALRSVGPAAREEIFALFPELREGGVAPEPVRPLPSGRRSRKLAVRHLQQGRSVLC